MAEELNSYFASVFTVEDTSGMPEHQENQGAQVSQDTTGVRPSLRRRFWGN